MMCETEAHVLDGVCTNKGTCCYIMASPTIIYFVGGVQHHSKITCKILQFFLQSYRIPSQEFRFQVLKFT